MTSDKTIVIDTPEGIEFFRLLSVKGRCKLQLRSGLRFRNSPFVFARKHYKLEGNNASILAQLEKMVEDALSNR